MTFKINLSYFLIMINNKRLFKIKNQFLVIAKSYLKTKKKWMIAHILHKIKKEEQ